MTQFIIDFFRIHFNIPNEVGRLIVDFIPRKLKISDSQRLAVQRAFRTKRVVTLSVIESYIVNENLQRTYTSGGKTYTYADHIYPDHDFIIRRIDYEFRDLLKLAYE